MVPPWSILTFPVLIFSLLLGALLQPLSLRIEDLSLTYFGEAPRILLVTAHPDDECLFFAPTLLSLQSHSTNSEIFSLCLSAGDADGLGAIRRKELEGSLDVLGVHQDKRWVIDHPQLRDNISVSWDPVVISEVVGHYVYQHNITTILTFDHQGVSSHPNHISIPAAAEHLLSTFRPRGNIAPPTFFTLISVPLVQKYLGPLGAVLAKLGSHTTDWLGLAGNMPLAVSGLAEYWVALQAMKRHRSQLVWFRWLYVSFSRYMWVNEWEEITPALQHLVLGELGPSQFIVKQ